MYGKTCFKCAGKGQTLTKRGQVAAKWMNEQNLIPASEVTVGMRVKALGVTITVRTIEQGCESKSLRDGVWVENPRGLCISGQSHSFDVPTDYKVQVIRSREDQIELLRAAIAYQNTLTKAGTVQVRKQEAA